MIIILNGYQIQFFYQMTVKITFLFIIPCLKSLQAAMEALCENDDDQFKIQIHLCRNLLVLRYILNYSLNVYL
jgi:hypothetical protein